MVIEQKLEHLKALFSGMSGCVVAYSGGVDSSLLLKVASEVLGASLVAVTAVSETYPQGELAAAKDFARSLGVAHRILHTEELTYEEFVQNSPERCYFCKRELFGKLKEIAETEGLSLVLDGSNTDDLRDYRPGSKAATEFSVRSPLREAGFSKQDVRACASMLGLTVWDKPSLACLSSRIPYGTRITPRILQTIERAEDWLHAQGFRQVRVRHHGDTARIEVEPSDFPRVVAGDGAQKIAAALKRLGYTYVCLDLQGYRTGSMNEGMKDSGSQKPGVRSRK